MEAVHRLYTYTKISRYNSINVSQSGLCFLNRKRIIYPFSAAVQRYYHDFYILVSIAMIYNSSLCNDTIFYGMCKIPLIFLSQQTQILSGAVL